MDNIVNKNELVRRIADRTGLSHNFTAALVGSFIDEITQAVVDGDRVRFSGFGSFEPVERAERAARNPHTGEPRTVPARTMPVFRPGAVFKARVIEAAEDRKALEGGSKEAGQ